MIPKQTEALVIRPLTVQPKVATTFTGWFRLDASFAILRNLIAKTPIGSDAVSNSKIKIHQWEVQMKRLVD
jgi:hypothetical protein